MAFQGNYLASEMTCRIKEEEIRELQASLNKVSRNQLVLDVLDLVLTSGQIF